jgi:hypothetical protein
MFDADIPALIWYIRDAKEITVGELKKKLWADLAGVPQGVRMRLRQYERVEQFPTLGNQFDMLLRSMIEAGLIDVGTQEKALSDDSVLRLSQHVQPFLTAMGISLSEVLAKDGYRMQAFPIFGTPSQKIGATDVFVAMPFREDLRDVYDVAVLTAVQESGLTCRRGDDFKGSQHIMSEVWSSIVQCRICVVDCTDNNANVFYELGIADTLGREVILIAQTVKDVPFDVRHRRFVDYENHPQGLIALREELKNQFRELGSK